MDVLMFEALLKRPESETLDFKKEHYKLGERASMLSFVKDVVAMANTPRDGTSYIVLGVKNHPDGTNDLIGLTPGSHIDDADLQTQFTDIIAPVPRFSYKTISHNNLQFGVIEIPPVKIGPCVPLREVEKLHKWAIYYRRNTRNEEAKRPEELASILNWFGTKPRPLSDSSDDPAWECIVNATNGFSPDSHYMLVTSPVHPEPKIDLASVGLVPWVSAVDFDVKSDTDGLLAVCKATLETHRSLHVVTSQERPTFNLRSGTYWYFARGLLGRSGTVDEGDWKSWNKTLGRPIAEHLANVAAVCAPQAVTCVVLWYGSSGLIRHLQSTLESAFRAFGGSLKIVIATDNPADLRQLASENDAELFDISLNQLCEGFSSRFRTAATGNETTVLLPSNSGAEVRVAPDVYNWLAEELDIVHLNVGLAPGPGREIALDFLRGNEVSWYDLNLRCDVERDIESRLQSQVLADLQRRRTSRINLYHAPGAGGTTLARRILWNNHRTFPCAILHQTVPADTAERLFRITSVTEQAALLLIDGADVAERQVNELYDALRSRQIPVTVLQVLRRFNTQREDVRSRNLHAELSKNEALRFTHVYSQAAAHRKHDVSLLLASSDSRLHTAFYFGLHAFQSDFVGLEGHVKARLEALTSNQQKIIGFLALAHHYAQRPLPAQGFAEMLDIPSTRIVDFSAALPVGTRDLIVQVGRNVWRTTHDLIALEVLRQLLSPPGATDSRLWPQYLSSWSVSFIDFCRGTSPVVSAELLEVARRMFIYRDNAELLGTERSGLNLFSQLIQDIPSDEGALNVLIHLSNTFPDEPHVWAHLGRFYSNKLKRFDEALKAMDRAIALAEYDGVLHHMRGMILRQHVYKIIDEAGELDTAVKLAKESGNSFGRARNVNPDDEHGYISEVQMLARLVDYAGSRHGGGVLKYLSAPSADPYLRDCFEHAEDLLERVRRNREGQGASSYEADCRAKLDTLYGRHEQALQIWDNLRSRKDVYRPPVNRQIVWTYLARAHRSWNNITPENAVRMVELLEESSAHEPTNDTNARLWIQAIRRLNHPPSLDSIIERVSYWRTNAGSLDASFYLYVIYALQAMDGSALARESALRLMDECKKKANPRRNRTKSFEWLGRGKGVRQLVHHSQLGEWQADQEFWSNTQPLERIQGRIAKVESEQSGIIELERSGISAFFVPARGGYRRSISVNQRVSFHLGFSYDGLRAWNVQDIS